jgi:hypothetical protein
MHFKIKKIKGGKYLYIIKNKRINGKITQPIQKYVGTADQVYGLTAAQYLLLIIIGRSEHALSRNVLDGYFGESALQFIWVPAYQFSSQKFLNYMSKLDEETIQNIELDVSRTMIKLGL